MTRLRTAALFVAVVAGAYAALMLIIDRLIDFGVAAAICAAASVTAALIAYADSRISPLGRGGFVITDSGSTPANRRLSSRR